MTDDRGFIVARADHVGFSVTSLETALGFWVDGLGAVLVRRGEMGGDFLGEVTGARGANVRFAVLDLAGQTIELLDYADAPPRRGTGAAPFDPGAAHLALVVDDLDAALARVARHGWHAQGRQQAISAGTRAGTRVMYVVGPAGETIELMQPPAGSPPLAGGGART